MKSSRTIQYKAFFLLVTFSMNTVIGLACSIGVNMGYNSKHHSHDGANMRDHSNKSQQNAPDFNIKDGYHDEVVTHGYETGVSIASFKFQNEDCCKDFIVGFNALDKFPVKQSPLQQKITYLSSFLIAVFFTEANKAKDFALLQRNPLMEIDYSPPDINVFIQSFLI